MLINSLLYKGTIWQKNCTDKIEFPLTGCGSRWGLLIFITGTLWRPSQLGTRRNQLQLKENGKVTLTMGFHKIDVFFPPLTLLHCCINVPILYLWVTVMLLTGHFYLCKVLVSSETYLVYLQKYPHSNKPRQVTFWLWWQNPPVDIIQERHRCMRKS